MKCDKFFIAIFVCALRVELLWAQDITALVNNYLSQECPTGRNRHDIIDKDSFKVEFRPAYTLPDATLLNVKDTGGKWHNVSFPGCYTLRVTLKVLQPLTKPYAEAFIVMGSKIPCRTDIRERRLAQDVCVNITQSDWCPTSSNDDIRHLNRDTDSSCIFCDICARGQRQLSSAGRTADGRKVVSVGGGSRLGDDCRLRNDDAPTGSSLGYSIDLQLCTPSKEELDGDNKLTPYWNHLKQGSITFVVHLLERHEPAYSGKQFCKQLCQNERKLGDSAAARKQLRASIDKACAPVDSYVGCVYTTLRFDVLNGR